MSHDKYWAVALDGRPAKTFYKDTLALPSRALAIACAEEWDMQGDNIDVKSLHVNQMLAKGIRAADDINLLLYMREKIE